MLTALLVSCGTSQFVQKGVMDGVEVAYRWNHPAGKPSELLLKLKNTDTEDRRIHMIVDLYYQGRTVETLIADTCIRSGQTLNGKLNGIYFRPEQLTTEQIKSGDAQAEVTKTEVSTGSCE